MVFILQASEPASSGLTHESDHTAQPVISSIENNKKMRTNFGHATGHRSVTERESLSTMEISFPPKT
jgi:hypothetical protein